MKKNEKKCKEEEEMRRCRRRNEGEGFKRKIKQREKLLHNKTKIKVK